MNNIIIKNASISDLDEILKIYENARKFMEKAGNPTQWGKNHPSKELLLSFISNNSLYIGVNEKNEIEFVFAFIIGEDPTYSYIEGKWGSNEKYGTIHAVVSSFKSKNIFKIIFDFCLSKINYIRIDTHENNIVMQKAIIKNGFKKRGIIYVRDHSSRIAFDYLKDN